MGRQWAASRALLQNLSGQAAGAGSGILRRVAKCSAHHSNHNPTLLDGGTPPQLLAGASSEFECPLPLV
eukprot:5381375-Pyramimonas_sp.AAC.1